MTAKKKPWVVAITGASGAIYGVRLCQELRKAEIPIHVIITDAGWRVINEELNWPINDRNAYFLQAIGSNENANVILHPVKDIGASIASGSFLTAGMVVVPCSMGTLSNIASGSSRNLLERTADVMLKEGRPLILVPRESPLHAIHIENMLKLSRIGVSIVPAMPAFYHQPKSVMDIVDFLTGKLLDRMGIEHALFTRWGADENDKSKNGSEDRSN